MAKLKEQQKSLHDAKTRLEKVSETIAMLAERLDKADYELKRLAVEALDVKVVIHVDGNIRISGSIPSEVQLSSANSLPS